MSSTLAKAEALAESERVVSTLVCGAFIHSSSFDELEFIPDGVMGLSSTGEILFVSTSPLSSLPPALSSAYDVSSAAVVSVEEVTGDPAGFVVPGYVDTHLHAPQYAFAGQGMDLPLLQWLATYTYPMESRFGNQDFVDEVYDALLARLARVGTTSSAVFGSLHAPASVSLAQKGMCVFVMMCDVM